MRRWSLYFGLGAMVLIVSACSSGSDEPGTANITDRQLEAMLLPLDSFGIESRDDYELSKDSGLHDNAEAIQDADAPDDEKADIEKFGRQKSLDETYVSSQALFERKGVFLIGDSVTLFDRPKGARSEIDDMVSDLKGDTYADESSSIESWETFDPGLGDGSRGVVMHLRGDGSKLGTVSDVDLYTTAVIFSRDRVQASVGISRLDGQDIRREVVERANEMDDRIEAALAGEGGSETASSSDQPAVELLRAAQERMSGLRTVRQYQEVSVREDGVTTETTLESLSSSPDKTYLVIDGFFEMFIAGNEAYLLLDDEWQCAPNAFGYDASLSPDRYNLRAQFDLADIASSVKLLSDTFVDGRTLRQLQITIDAATYASEIANQIEGLMGQGEGFGSIDGGTVVLDIFVHEGTNLVYELQSDARFRVGGESVSVRSESRFSDFNKPVRLPLHEPYPSCDGEMRS